MFTYFSGNYKPPTPDVTKTPRSLSEFQIWYGRSNYWNLDMNQLDSDLLYCVQNNVSGYMISLSGWNGSLGTGSILNDYEYILNKCRVYGLWLIVTIYDAKLDGEIGDSSSLDNLSSYPKAWITDTTGDTIYLKETEEIVLGSKLELNNQNQTIVRISDIDIPEGVTYDNPQILISPSPGGVNAVYSASFEDNKLEFTRVNQGTKYYPTLKNIPEVYKGYVDKIKALGLSNVLVLPIVDFNIIDTSDVNDPYVSFFNYCKENIPSDNLLWNGSGGNPQGSLIGYVNNVIHSDSSELVFNYYAGRIVTCTPNSYSSTYSELLVEPYSYNTKLISGQGLSVPTYIECDYDDSKNSTDVSKLSAWITKLYNAGVKVVGYDAFYRKSVEREIFSALDYTKYIK